MKITSRVLGPAIVAVLLFSAAVTFYKFSGATDEPVLVASPKAERSIKDRTTNQSGHVTDQSIVPTPRAGRDGDFVSAPPRAPGSLVDPLSRPGFDRGEKVNAWAQARGIETPELATNQIGEFPRIFIKPEETATVRLRWPDGKPGDRAVAAVEDGGKFEDGKPVNAFNLDENRELSFKFVAGTELGLYRVSVRHGGQTKTIQFWVEPKSTIAER